MNEMLRLDWTERPLRRRLAAIAFLDVVGYSRRMAVNEEETLHAWSTLRHTVIEPEVIAWRGRIVDRAGDGIFAEFGSALEALHWAVNVQNTGARHFHPGEPIKLRIALHLADVIDGPDGEVQGDGVNTAARLQTYAEAGGVIVSQAVVDAVQGKTDAVFADLGQLKLRNIARPVRAFRLTVAPGPRSQELAWRRAGRAIVAAASLSLVLLAPILDWRTSAHEKAEHLLRQGLAIKCPSYPCAREWLDQRALFQQAIAVDPTFARPYAEAALTYTSFLASRLTTDAKEDFRIAAKLATQAVALAPDQAFAYNARGEVLRQDPEKLEDALTAYMRVLSIEPHQTTARANAGWLLLLLGRPAEAEVYVQAALDAEPASIRAPYWLNRMGLAELFLDHDGHGAEFFRRAIAQQSAVEAAAAVGVERRINLAAALALNGDLDAARTAVEDLRRQYPPLSTNNIWTCVCSSAPQFKAGMERLRKGAILAGVSDTN